MDFHFGDEEDYFNFKNGRNHRSSIISDNTRPLSGISSSSTSSSSYSYSLSSAESPLSSTSYTGPIYFEPVPCSPSCYSCSSASSSRLRLEDLLGLGDDCDSGDDRGDGEEEKEEEGEGGDEREEERDEWDNEVGDVVCDLGVDQGGFGWPEKGELIEFEFDFDFDFDFESRRRRTGSDRERDRDKEDYDGPHDWQSFNGDDDESNGLFDPYNELSDYPPASSSLSNRSRQKNVKYDPRLPRSRSFDFVRKPLYSFSDVNSLLNHSGLQQAIRMATQIGSQNMGGMGNTGSAHRQSQQQQQQTRTGGSEGPNSVLQVSALHFHTHVHIYASSGDDNDRSRSNQVECKHGNGNIDNTNVDDGIVNGGNVDANADAGMDDVLNNSDSRASTNERSFVASNGRGMSSSSSSSTRQATDTYQVLPSDVNVDSTTNDFSGMEHLSSATASSAGSSAQQAQQSRPMVPSSHSALVPSRAPSLAPALSQIVIPNYVNRAVNSTGTSSSTSSASSGGPSSAICPYSAYGYQNASVGTSVTRDPGNGYGYNMNNGNTSTAYNNSTNYGGWTQAQGYGGYMSNALAAPASISSNNNTNGSYNNYGNNYNNYNNYNKNNNAIAIRTQEQGFDANYRSNEMMGMIPSSSTYPSSTSVYHNEYIADPFQNSGSWQVQQTWGGMTGYQGVGLGAATGSGIGAGVGTSRGLGYSMNDQNNQNLPMLMREFEPTMDRGYNMGNGFNSTGTVDTTFRQTSVPRTLEYPPHLLNHLALDHYFDNNNGLAELNANGLPNVEEAHYDEDEESESDFDDGEGIDDDEGVDDDVNIPERKPEFGQLGDQLHVQETGQNQLQSQYQYQGPSQSQWIGRSSIQLVSPTPTRSPLPTAFFKQENPNSRN